MKGRSMSPCLVPGSMRNFSGKSIRRVVSLSLVCLMIWQIGIVLAQDYFTAYAQNEAAFIVAFDDRSFAQGSGSYRLLWRLRVTPSSASLGQTIEVNVDIKVSISWSRSSLPNQGTWPKVYPGATNTMLVDTGGLTEPLARSFNPAMIVGLQSGQIVPEQFEGTGNLTFKLLVPLDARPGEYVIRAESEDAWSHTWNPCNAVTLHVGGLTISSGVDGVVVDGVSSSRIHVKLSMTENRRVTLTDDKTKPQTTNAVNGEAVFEYVPDLKALSLAYGDIPRGGYELTLTASDDQQHSASMNLKLYRKPIVLVHGIFSSPNMWVKMKDSLQNDGFEVFCVDYLSRNAADITSIAETEAASTIKQVMTEYANRKISLAKVDVLAHSMGGLVMRQYIVSSTSKGDDIGTLIMIGTPHLGSPLPTLYLRHMNDPNFKDIINAIGIHEGPALKQLNSTNSEFLKKLNAASLNSNVKYYNIIGELNWVGQSLKSKFPNDIDCYLLEGDGVVSIASQRGDGTSLHSNGNYYILASHFTYEPYPWLTLVGEGEHGDTATVAIALLKGEPVDQRFERQLASSPSMGGNVKCPVRLSFYDSSGNPVPLAGEGETEEGKPALYYWEQGDEGFFLIVNAFGEYRIVAEGTDTGTFDLTMFRDTTGATTYVSYASVAVMKSSQASVTVSDQSSYVMGMDTDGDGKVDKTISPTSLETVQRDGGGSERGDAWLAMVASGILVLIVVVVGVAVMCKRGLTVHGILKTAATYRPRQTMQPHDSAFCINCGKQIISNSPYCPYCGDKQGV